MDISGFLAAVTNNMKNRYLSLAQDISRSQTPRYYKNTPTDAPTPAETASVSAAPAETQQPTTDSYEPSGASSATTDKTAPSTDSQTKPTDSESGQTPVDKQPDGTYYYKRKAELSYKLDLSFNLSAMMQTVEKLADGDVSSVDQFAAAAFGLNADFGMKGYQKIDTNMTNEADPYKKRSFSMAKARTTGALAAQTKNFALQSFYSEASKVRRSMKESVHGDHRRAVNKIALRYRLDNQFSMAFADRFNVQTQQVADKAPDSVGDYVNSAGNIAAGGSTDLMSTFFNAVDGYLADSEQGLLDKVTAFFNQAAEELGFSGDMVDMARDQLTGTIQTFFDRVGTALDGIETQFVPQAQVPETPDVPTTDLPDTDADSGTSAADASTDKTPDVDSENVALPDAASITKQLLESMDTLPYVQPSPEDMHQLAEV